MLLMLRKCKCLNVDAKGRGIDVAAKRAPFGLNLDARFEPIICGSTSFFNLSCLFLFFLDRARAKHAQTRAR